MQNLITKTGDFGKTKILNGELVSKGSKLIRIIGECDDLSSGLSVMVLVNPEDKQLKSINTEVQKMLSRLMAKLQHVLIEGLAGNNIDKTKFEIPLSAIENIERFAESMRTGPLKDFRMTDWIIKEGEVGFLLSSYVRKFESSFIEFLEHVDDAFFHNMDDGYALTLFANELVFLNRMSDAFFYLGIVQKLNK
jgi:cob(I)alamin adenosyltransferase